MLYASECGFALPNASEELTSERRVRKTFDLPATAQAGRLYLLARCYPENRLPMVVTVNGRPLAQIRPDDLAGRYAWYELAIPASVLRVGQNLVECWCDAEAMCGWSLAVDYGSGSTHSQVSTDAGRTWSSDQIGYLNIGRGEYIIRIRLAEGDDPVPPATVHEDPTHLRLGNLRMALPAEVVDQVPILPRLRALATWTSTQWPYRNEQQATQYAPWDPATILAWGKAESGHDGHLPIVMCVHYTIVFVAACESLGMSARCVVFAEDINSGIGHFVAEVWVPELDKWVLVDPNLDAMFLRDGTPLSAREVQAAPEGLSTLVSLGPGHDYQAQTPSMRTWIARYFLTGDCFRHRAVWPRTDFMSHPECSPPFHGATAYSELDLVWEDCLANKATFGMFRYFAPQSWFDEPPRQPAVPDQHSTRR